MTQDEQTLNVLAILHYILGALIIAWSLFNSMFFIFMGVLALVGKLPDSSSEAGWQMVLMGVAPLMVGCILGILSILAGRKLQRRVSWRFCFAIAMIECLELPFGTALGIFTIITLRKKEVIRIFAGPRPPVAEVIQ